MNSGTERPKSIYIQGGRVSQRGDFSALGIFANSRDLLEARDAAKHRTMHRTALYNNELSGSKCLYSVEKFSSRINQTDKK